MTASIQPLSSAPLPGIRHAYMSAHVMVQMPKNEPNTNPGEAPPFRASVATISLQYANPINTVTTDAQRNHHSARDMSSGNTLPLVTLSRDFMNGTLTRLKK